MNKKANVFEMFKRAKVNSLLRLDKAEEMLIITNLGEKTNAVFGKYNKFEVIYKEGIRNEK